jgi:Mg2+ and Co2+ transporter CorA
MSQLTPDRPDHGQTCEGLLASGTSQGAATPTATTARMGTATDAIRGARDPQPGRKDDVIAIVTSAAGIRRVETANGVGEALSTGAPCWIDIVGSDPVMQATLVRALGLDPADETWILRFAQAGRMLLSQRKLRAVTWASDRQLGHTEIHLLQTQQMIVTVWAGDATALDDLRRQFTDRAAGLAGSPLGAAAIVLQLLLATLYKAVDDIDASLERLLRQYEAHPGSVKLSTLTQGFQRLRSFLVDIDRYGSTVRLAVAGVEALPGIDARAAQELNDYADQVEDVSARLQQRNEWAADITQSYVGTIAERQATRISQLTVVSIVFLPLTFLTGFFGMNFNWMIDSVGGPLAFLLLGVLLPAASAALTVLWLKRRGLI